MGSIPSYFRSLWASVLGRFYSPSVCFLVDNGSMKASSTVSLRTVAGKLQAALGRGVEVWPVSARFSDRIPASELGGKTAFRLESALQNYIRKKGRNLVILPFFFAECDTVTHFIPETLTKMQVSAKVATPLLPDGRICQILSKNVREVMHQNSLSSCPVVVVDHGSPTPEVSASRDEVVAQMRQEFGPELSISAVCMEKRPECDFNGPLLEDALDAFTGDVVVALMFLQPGRHAGPGGDIEQIIERAETRNPKLRCHRTSLVAQDPLVIQILRDRYMQTQ